MFASLPNETIVEILSHLPPESVAACQLVCRRIHEVFQEASYARYKNALAASNGIDNTSSPLTPQEKFERLRQVETSWAFLRPTFFTSARVKTAASSLYDLTGDSYVVGNSLKTALHCLSLPSKKTEEPKWREIDLGNPCVDFGLSVYENDLLAVVSRFALLPMLISSDEILPVDLKKTRKSSQSIFDNFQRASPIQTLCNIALMSPQSFGEPQFGSKYLAIISFSFSAIKPEECTTPSTYSTGRRECLRPSGRHHLRPTLVV